MSAADRSARPIFPEKEAFRPKRPTDLNSAGLNGSLIEGLSLKFLVGVGITSGRSIASQLGLPFGLIVDELHRLQKQKLLTYADVADMGDYNYSLTEAGRARAREYAYGGIAAYVGTAPVSYEDYVASVLAQTITAERPHEEDLRRAFSDLLIADEMFRILGPAINSGRGMFLYGAAWQRQDEHRRADHQMLRQFGLDSQGAEPGRATGQAVRSLGPRDDSAERPKVSSGGPRPMP